MNSQWSSQNASKYTTPLGQRVYTSRLLGQDRSLVLHGGGNTSVKDTYRDILGQEHEVLWVKGSGWDLVSIEEAGFAPVRMDALLQMAELNELSDTEMVTAQRSAMLNPYAPNPSVEAILHAIIPFKFVDHTHADAVVTISNTPHGEEILKEIYQEEVLFVPYVMPGFVLAKEVYDLTRHVDWTKYKGMILLNHGVFSFANSAQESYERMIELVTKAENYLKKQDAWDVPLCNKDIPQVNLKQWAKLRKEMSQKIGHPLLLKLNQSSTAMGFVQQEQVADIAARGPITPDHVIRTKRIPMVVTENWQEDLSVYKENYERYFNRHATDKLTCLDRIPRWLVWPGKGVASIGKSIQDIQIIEDISHHTMLAIQRAEQLSAWKPLPESDIFDVEYWELEQAKLKKSGSGKSFQGKVAVVTGAANGIGKAIVNQLLEDGAVVVAIDKDEQIKSLWASPAVAAVVCDVTDDKAIKAAIENTVKAFGGIDILVSNVGIFVPSQTIEESDVALWDQTIHVNLTSHHKLLRECTPYLKEGLDPAIVIIGSKNVPAPGPGVAAYSVSKAGLTQLARVAALELAPFGIRVNIVHPNAIFDTQLWTKEKLEERAEKYHMSVEEYKTNNLLKVEVCSVDVARLAVAMCSSIFAKTTGAQVPVDGGNERVL